MNSDNWLERTELLLGNDRLDKLINAHVLIAGLGGVGGYAAEQVCRSGVGKITLVDFDVVQPSNRNRQIIALKSTEGMKKSEVLHHRLLDINPGVELITIDEYLIHETIDKILDDQYDYIIDAIDTLTPKVQLLAKARQRGIRIVSSMGAGGKTNPEKIEITDISKSHHCRFAYIVRKYLRKYDVHEGIKVVFSPEPVSKSTIIETSGEQNKKSVVGTISYMPAIFGCFCASVVIRDLIEG
jgi:tRNA threonylcarbamoyladenosine dehydratase